MDDSGEKYQMFDLRNKEFTFDVDVSGLPCGLNGALYFVEMEADGGLSTAQNNKAGAKYGTGYCDSQCPQDIKFINGEVRLPSTPSRLLLTSHPTGQHRILDPLNRRPQLRHRLKRRLLRRNGHLGSQLHLHRFHPPPLQRHRPPSLLRQHHLRHRRFPLRRNLR